MDRISELLILSQRGDRRALEELVRTDVDRLFAIAFRISADAESARDAVQETFLRILEGRSPLRRRDAARAWLARVVTRIAIDQARGASSRIAREREYAVARGVDSSSPEQSAMAQELEGDIERAFSSLSPETRASIWLHVVEGQGVREVASCLGKGRSSVAERIKNGLARMRRYLQAHGVVLPPALSLEVALRRLPPPETPADLAPEIVSNAAGVAAGSGGPVSTSGAEIVLKKAGATAMGGKNLWLGLGVLLLSIPIIVVFFRDSADRGEDRVDDRVRAPTPVVRELPAEEERNRLSDAGGAAQPAPAPARPPLRIRIVDPDGEAAPSPEAFVAWVRSRSVYGRPRDIRRAFEKAAPIKLHRTADGDLVCPTRGDRVACLAAVARGFLPKYLEIDVPEAGLSETLVISLEPGDVVRGRVVDGRGGAPIEGARVGLPGVGAPSEVADPEPATLSLREETRTDGEGRFRLVGVEKTIWAAAEGLAATRVTLEEMGDTELRIPLYPPSRLRLIVRQADGSPVAGFRYRLDHGGTWNDNWDGREVEGGEVEHRWLHRCSVGRRGLHFVDNFTVGVRVDGVTLTRYVKATLGEETVVEFALGSPGTRVTGVALGPLGAPVRGAEIFAARIDKPLILYSREPLGGYRYKSTTSAADGTFALDVQPGHLILVGRSDSYPFYVSEKVLVRDGDSVAHVVRFPEPTRIAGRVVGDAEEIAGEHVSLRPTYCGGLWPHIQLRWSTTTDEAGAFRFDNVPLGSFSVERNSSTGAGSRYVHVESGGTYELTFGAPQRSGVTLNGQVVSSGRPVEGVEVLLTDRGFHELPLGKARTDAQGFFEIRHVVPGEHRLSLEPPSGTGLTDRETTVSIADMSTEVRIDLTPLSLSGGVSSTSGPTAGAKVSVRGLRLLDGFQSWEKLAATESDPAGRFAIDGLYPGDLLLVVEKEGYVTRTLGSSPGEDVDVFLRETRGRGALTFDVTDETTGRSIAPAFVRVYSDDGEESRISDSAFRTDPEAPLILNGVPGGAYLAVVCAGTVESPEYGRRVLPIVCREGVDQTIDVPMGPGGSFRLLVSPPDGILRRSSSLQILDERGERVRFPRARFYGGGAEFFGDKLGLGLPVGELTLRIHTDGYKPAVAPVRIRHARMQRVVVRLAPADLETRD